MNSAIRSLPQTLVVASNDATRDAVVNLLRALGIGVASTDHVDQCIAKVPAAPSLVILHPDGFRFDQIVGILFALRRERPDVRAVLVTESPERYVKLIVTGDKAPQPSVITMSVFASVILETLASSAAADTHELMRAAFHGGPSAFTGGAGGNAG